MHASRLPALCEDHDVCRPGSLSRSPPVQTISAFTVRVILLHKLEHLRASEETITFDGERSWKFRALQPYVVSGRDGYRSAFFKEHHEFVGQGWWRGPYPRS